jgi:hypothetical protein
MTRKKLELPNETEMRRMDAEYRARPRLLPALCPQSQQLAPAEMAGSRHALPW